MTTVPLHICDACGREDRSERAPRSWCGLNFFGGELDGESPLLCDRCMITVYDNPVIMVLLERRRADRERGCRISKSDPRS